MLVGNSSVAIRKDFADPAPAGNNERTNTKIHKRALCGGVTFRIAVRTEDPIRSVGAW